MQFDGINLNPNWENEDPADLSDDPIEEELSDEDLDEGDTVRAGPRRSTRLKN